MSNRAAISVSFEHIIEMMRVGYRVEHGIELAENGVPDEAIFVGASFREQHPNTVYLIFEHDNFPPSLHGEPLPILEAPVHRPLYWPERDPRQVAEEADDSAARAVLAERERCARVVSELESIGKRARELAAEAIRES